MILIGKHTNYFPLSITWLLITCLLITCLSDITCACVTRVIFDITCACVTRVVFGLVGCWICVAVCIDLGDQHNIPYPRPWEPQKGPNNLKMAKICNLWAFWGEGGRVYDLVSYDHPTKKKEDHVMPYKMPTRPAEPEALSSAASRAQPLQNENLENIHASTVTKKNKNKGGNSNK